MVATHNFTLLQLKVAVAVAVEHPELHLIQAAQAAVVPDIQAQQSELEDLQVKDFQEVQAVKDRQHTVAVVVAVLVKLEVLEQVHQMVVAVKAATEYSTL
jgi:hypothetical protein